MAKQSGHLSKVTQIIQICPDEGEAVDTIKRYVERHGVDGLTFLTADLAQEHAETTGEPDMEAGDLIDTLQFALGLLDRKKYDAVVEFLVENNTRLKNLLEDETGERFNSFKDDEDREEEIRDLIDG